VKFMPHKLKSPLRYPGGKSRAVTQILKYIPPDVETICAPFLGGGSIELALAAKGIEVYAYDNFEPVIHFWRELLRHPKQLCSQVQRFYPLTKTQFYHLQKNFKILPAKQKAAAFYVLNRASFSGVTFRGGMSPYHPRFTKKCIEQLATFDAKHLHVACLDFKPSIAKHPHDFLYLDPPYYNSQKLYGDNNENVSFDHAILAHLLHQRNNWILSYNDCSFIRSLYKGLEIKPLHWKYGMNTSKRSNEILILSKDLLKNK
jgi:DNA adenine methylase